jgi:hypothetical protein
MSMRIEVRVAKTRHMCSAIKHSTLYKTIAERI